MAASFYGELIIRVRMDTGGVAKGVKEVDAQTQALAKSQRTLAKTGLAMQNVGRTMTQYYSLPVAAGLAYATYSAYQYQKSMIKVKELTGLTAAEASNFSDKIREASAEIGNTGGPQAAAEAYYFLASSGLNAQEAFDALTVAMKANVAGMGDIQVTADVVSSAINVYRDSGMKAAKAMDILMRTIEVGKAEPSALAASLGRIMPIANQLGVGLAELGGNVAALTLGGLSSAEAVTSLRGSLVALVSPAQMSIDQLKELGTSYQEVTRSIREKGLLPTLKMLWELTGHNMLTMRKIIPNVRATAGVMSLLGDSYEHNLEVIARVADHQGKLNKTYRDAAQTDVAKFNRALNQLKSTFIEVGAVVLPVVTEIIRVLGDLVGTFEKLPEWAQKASIGFAMVTAALWPLVSVAGSVVRGIALVSAKRAVAVAGTAAENAANAALTASNTTLAASETAVATATATRAANVAAVAAAAGPSALAIIGIGAALAAATIGVGLLVNEIRKAKLRANLTPEFQVLFDKDAFEREMKRSHWDKRVIEGVVYWDYTVVPRKKPGDDTGKTVAEQIQRGAQSAADRIAQTQDWVAKQVERLQAEAFKFGGKDSLAAIFGSGEGAYGGLAIRPRIEEYTAIIAELEKTLALGGKQFGRGFVPFKPSEIASLNSQLYLYKENLAGAQRIWDEAQAKQATLMELEPEWDFAAGRKRLREQLRQYLFDMKAYLAGDRSFLSVQPPRVDLTKSAAKVKGQVARIKQWLTNLSQTTVIPVEIKERKINATIDTIEKKLERIRIQVVRGGGWTADLKAKDKSLRDALETAKTDLQNLDASTYQPSLILDATDAKADVDAFNKEWRSIQDKSVTLTTYVKRVPIGKSAWGAIIKKPEITLVGEEGPEVIIPLTKPRRAKQLLRESGLARYTEPAVLKVAATSATASQAPPTVVENHYHSHISLPQGIVVSDVERFGRSVTPFVDSNLGVAARRRKRGVPSF